MSFSQLPVPTDYQGQCDIHGNFTGHCTFLFGREIKSQCPECEKAREAKEAEERAEQDRQRILDIERKRIEAKLGRAAIPARFQGKRFDDYQADTDGQRKALALCKGYADDFATHYDDGRCLMLLGRVGCGKTHLASAIVWHLCTQTKFSGVYRTLPSLVQDIRATYGKDVDFTEADIHNVLGSCSLLVLDEIGATKSSEFELALLFTIINGRYESKLPTVIVSNLAPKELHTAIGERCVDRLREGGGIIVAFDWESKRRELK